VQTAKRLIGEAAKAQQFELQSMSDDIKSRITISVMTLAARVIKRTDLLCNVADPWAHLQTQRRRAIG
jgi:hypothetical protein